MQPGTGKRTVIMGMEDGPATQDPAVENSQLYMYVGEKDRSAGATVLERNGLVGGTLYVFAAEDPPHHSEPNFQTGTIAGEWVAIPGATRSTRRQLEAASDAAGAMIFARPEDGAFNPRNDDEYFFVTTGGAAGANELGRVYSLDLDPRDPTKAGEADRRVQRRRRSSRTAATSRSARTTSTSSGDYLMIQEDGTTESRAVMARQGPRRLDLALRARREVGHRRRARRPASSSFDPPGRDGVAVGPGVWETSGIIDTSALFGATAGSSTCRRTRRRRRPAPNTVEDGQLVLLKRR